MAMFHMFHHRKSSVTARTNHSIHEKKPTPSHQPSIDSTISKISQSISIEKIINQATLG